MAIVFRSSCREEFWKICVLRNSFPLILTSETFVKSVEKYLLSLPACNLTKKWTFSVIFQGIWTVFKTTVFFRTPLSNCVFIMFINFYFCWDIDFFLVSSLFVFFIEKTLHWIFWKCYSLFLYAVYQCEHVLFKLGESLPFW